MKKWFSASKKKIAAAKKFPRAQLSFERDSWILRFLSMTCSTIGDVVDMGDENETGILRMSLTSEIFS